VDYYLVPSRHALVVEEFTFGADHTTTALDCAAWSAADGWSSSAVLAKQLRAEPTLAVAVTREVAGENYPGALPSEDELRAYFTDPLPLSVAPPLRLRPDAPPIYRLLLAGDVRDAPSIVSGEHAFDGQISIELRQLRTLRAWAVDVTVRSADAPPVGPVLRRVIQAMRHNGFLPVTVELLG
jgi:hypothetical protein